MPKSITEKCCRTGGARQIQPAELNNLPIISYPNQAMVSNSQTQREKIYNALCMTLSERIDQVDWGSFSEDDWARFANLAVAEGVAPLIHWTFKHEDISSIDIPTTVKAQLMAAYYNTTAQNQVMFQELERNLEALNEADIPVIVLKGAALATTVYPEIGLRPMGDLDLLVKKQDLEIAKSTANGLGYVEEPYLSQRLNQDIGFNIHLWKNNQTDLKLEIHWGLVGGTGTVYEPDLDWFWEQLEPFTSEDKLFFEENFQSIFKLSPTAHILYQSAHLLIQHGDARSRLIWFYDIDRIIRNFRNTIDWNTLVKKEHEFRWSPALYSTFIKARSLFDTPIPKLIINALGEEDGGLTNKIISRKANQAQTAINRNINVLLSLKWSKRFHFVFAKFIPSPEFMRMRYNPQPEWMWPLSYLYRWMELGYKFFRTFILADIDKKKGE